MDHYYRILGLRPGASLTEIKKAYRRLALRYHPDRGAQSTEKFLEISEAYEALLEAHRRQGQGRRRVESFTPSEEAAFRELLRRMAEARAQERLRQFAAKKRRQQQLEEARSYRQGLYAVAFLVVAVVGGYLGYGWFTAWQIERDPVMSYARVTDVGANRVYYRLENAPQAQKVYDEYVWAVGLKMLAGNGLPLEIDHRFRVRYYAADPAYHKVLYHRPDNATLEDYFRAVADRVETMDLPVLDSIKASRSRLFSRCLVFLTYQHHGLDGLAQLYFYDEHPLENPGNSLLTWFFFRRGDTFETNVSQCSGRYRPVAPDSLSLP
ncbi:MAG: J domain-containing protein [Schleiferiaceae bacterium]|nr:J domain-containing protein [Schleiferiaceae bacterium]